MNSSARSASVKEDTSKVNVFRENRMSHRESPASESERALAERTPIDACSAKLREGLHDCPTTKNGAEIVPDAAEIAIDTELAVIGVVRCSVAERPAP